MTPKPAAVLYARYSPRPNAEKCESVEKQLEDLRRYCKEHKIRVAKEFSDKALSGSDDDRPGMWDAVNALKPGWLLVVTRFDRIARDSTFALNIIRHQIEKKRSKILSVSEPGANEDSPDGRLIRTMMLALAEYEREMIRARTRAAMRRHQNNGRRMSHKCPYGWSPDPEDPARMIPNDAERTIIGAVVTHHKRGLGLREIAKKMTAAGVTNRSGGKWHHTQVHRVLDREGVPRVIVEEEEVEAGA